jgi:glycosyltransferase involved in cell wall biosynthesis
MRVALIATASFDYCVEYAEMLADSCEVLLCIANQAITKRAFLDERIQIAAFDWPRHRAPSNMILIYKLLKQIRAWNPDVVHFLGENNIWLNLLPPLLRGIPVVATVHDIQYHPGDRESRRVPRVFIEQFIRQADAIIVHGETLRTAALGKLPVKKCSVFVLPHVPLHYYKRLAARNKLVKRSDGHFRVLFFGRIYKYKGLKYLVDAAPQVLSRLPSLRIIIAGRGDDLANGNLYIPSTEIFDVRYRFIPDNELAQLLTDVDVVALPYIEASQSGVLMAALAFSLPVIATDVGEIAELVRSTGAGVVITPRDSKALADAIFKIATNAPLRQALAWNAVNALQGELSNRTLARRAKEIYQEVHTTYFTKRGRRNVGRNV